MTCSFTQVRCLPKEGHHRGPDLVVDCAIPVAAATSALEKPRGQL